MLKKLGLVALLASTLAGCYCGPGYGYGYARPSYAYRTHYGYGWRHSGWRHW